LLRPSRRGVRSRVDLLEHDSIVAPTLSDAQAAQRDERHIGSRRSLQRELEPDSVSPLEEHAAELAGRPAQGEPHPALLEELGKGSQLVGPVMELIEIEE
jgi:hypothetical protein